MAKQRKSLEPSIDLSDDPPKELKVSIRASIMEKIVRYAEFYKEVKGLSGAPDKGKVVDRGLEKFFDEDDASNSYLNNGSAKRAPVAPASANQGAGG